MEIYHDKILVKNIIITTTLKGSLLHFFMRKNQIDTDLVMRTLYDSELFYDFLKVILDEKELHSYADDCSSINLHYASERQELG
ncbi:hypothetical protein [Colwellia sp. Arc7-635]|uniref:hypothetical protein n=1 Tax=Colwellia sp. Arc7-635 TaxID=2497879 RepID=UPI0013DF70EC|nr:hypothetical protein [Colwellia sp. Arc7-635]